MPKPPKPPKPPKGKKKYAPGDRVRMSNGDWWEWGAIGRVMVHWDDTVRVTVDSFDEPWHYVDQPASTVRPIN